MSEIWKPICCTLTEKEIKKFDDWIGLFSRNEALKALIATALDSNLPSDKYIQFLKTIPNFAMIEARITAGECHISELIKRKEELKTEIRGLETYRKKMEGEILQFVKSIPPPVPMILPPNPPFPFINAGTEVVKEEVESSKEEEELVEEKVRVEEEKKTTPRFRISSSG